MPHCMLKVQGHNKLSCVDSQKKLKFRLVQRGNEEELGKFCLFQIRVAWLGCEEGGLKMQHMKCLVLSLCLALLVLAIFHLQLRTEVSQLKASQVTQNTSTKNTQQQEALFHIFQILGFASCLVQRSCPG